MEHKLAHCPACGTSYARFDVYAWVTHLCFLFSSGLQAGEGGHMHMSTDLSSRTYRTYTVEELDERFDAEGNMIDWRQRFLDQGYAEGLAEGRTEGIAEGRKEGRLNILQQVLRVKFNVLSDAQMTTVLEHRDEPDLVTRIIKANTVDELLKSLC